MQYNDQKTKFAITAVGVLRKETSILEGFLQIFEHYRA